MARTKVLVLALAIASGLFLLRTTHAALRGGPTAEDTDSAKSSGEETPNEASAEAMTSEEPVAPDVTAPAPKPASKKRILSGSDGFIAGPDWEFDGFVAGGQGQEVRSMFVANDLLYLNVGKLQSIASGDRVGIYKRGSRVKDPQTGRFIGYEVRRVAISEITDKLDDETCSARVIQANDGVEIGDLVRRDSR